MELIAPTCFAPQFLAGIQPFPVRYLYGSLPQEPGLRAKAWLPAVNEEELAQHIRQASAQGISFLYTLNATCLANREFTAQGQRWLVERLGWLAEVGGEGVIVANPYIMELIKARFPQLKVYVSTLANVDSPAKARFFLNLGVDGLHLPEYVNRNFTLLRELRQAVDCPLALTVNLGCLLHCPIRDYHANFISHASESLDLGCYIDYSLMKCTLAKLLSPEELLKSPWIRPEDTPVYEEVGISQFKISGRVEDMAWLLKALKAYSTRRYSGDLNDLVSTWHDIAPFGAFPLRLPNSRLDGFIDFFRQSGYSMKCAECSYCHDWAERAVTVAGDPQAYKHCLEQQLHRFISGSFRAPLARQE